MKPTQWIKEDLQKTTKNDAHHGIGLLITMIVLIFMAYNSFHDTENRTIGEVGRELLELRK